MTHSHPLPFPVRDAADLKRAISYATRAKPEDRDSLRRYVASRARSLGHVDLLPPTWGQAPVPKLLSETTGLDDVFARKAEECGISTAKLKTVYFRGVAEYNDSAFDIGTPVMWGLARVQRFINAVARGEELGADADLFETEAHVTGENGMTLFVDASGIMRSVAWSDGHEVAALFKPGVVHSVYITEDRTVTVEGTLDEQPWVYTLNTATGEHDLRISDTVSP